MRNSVQISEERGPGQTKGISSWGWVCVLIVLTASIYPLALALANSLLTVRGSARAADIIVVLGGDGPKRAGLAARLWHDGAAPSVLVSGDGDCGSIRSLMMEQGVPGSIISTECRSRSTWENAEFSAPVLQQMNVRSAILVTSWFASRRALARFESTSKDIRWISIPVEPKVSLLRLALDRDGIQVLKEYPKTAWYGIRTLLGQSQ